MDTTRTYTRTAPGNMRGARPRRRRRRGRILLMALLALAIAGGAIAQVPSIVRGAAAAIESWSTGAPQSTPLGEWRQGSVPKLYQTDPQWASEPYAGGTIGENGCGPTCLSMVMVALTGQRQWDPSAMAAFSEQQGYVTNGMTAWALMTDGAATLGLTSEEVPADAGALERELTLGHPIICSVRPGDFTTTGHFIVLVGVTETGELEIRDPNSPQRTSQTWDVERVLSQCNNLWAFSV